ncbi:MAG: hypothetical protein OXS32_14050 [Verrucomicrobiales bacterium]|nr:hypothetical protein [Verrucomicrobiales bacterium]
METHDARRMPLAKRLAKRKARGRTRLNCKTTECTEYTEMGARIGAGTFLSP